MHVSLERRQSSQSRMCDEGCYRIFVLGTKPRENLAQNLLSFLQRFCSFIQEILGHRHLHVTLQTYCKISTAGDV